MEAEGDYQERRQENGTREIGLARELTAQEQVLVRSRQEPFSDEESIAAFEAHMNPKYTYPEWLEELRGKRLIESDFESLVKQLTSVPYDLTKPYSNISSLLETAEILHVPQDQIVRTFQDYIKKQTKLENSQSKELSKSIDKLAGRLESRIFDLSRDIDVTGYRSSEVVDGDGFSIEYDVSREESRKGLRIAVDALTGDSKNMGKERLFTLYVGKEKLAEIPSLREQVRHDWSGEDRIFAVIYPLGLIICSAMALFGEGVGPLHDLTVLPFYKVPRHVVRKAARGIKSLTRRKKILVESKGPNGHMNQNLRDYLGDVIANCDVNGNGDSDAVSQKANMVKFAFEHMYDVVKKDLCGVEKYVDGWKV